MEDIFKRLSVMDPEAVLAEIAGFVKKLFQNLDEEVRARFLMALLDAPAGDKVSSLVHLWLAECMGEGVDPTQMCQSLVNKVARSKQLAAIADPGLLVLFEDWFEELEAEVLALFKTRGFLDEKALAEALGLSRRGATFMLSKLRREGKLRFSDEKNYKTIESEEP